jgi:hypothetical protein
LHSQRRAPLTRLAADLIWNFAEEVAINHDASVCLRWCGKFHALTTSAEELLIRNFKFANRASEKASYA